MSEDWVYHMSKRLVMGTNRKKNKGTVISMSTRSRIGIMNEDGTITSVYCHNDGYVNGVGAILQEYYMNPVDVYRLLILGDLSILGRAPLAYGSAESEAIVMNGYDGELPYEKCISYNAWRGEDTPAITVNTIDDYRKLYEEYNYLYRDGEWYVACAENDYEYTPLTNVTE